MPKRFRVAFSFSGKKRDFVARVADVLAAKFGTERVLYDKYHEAEFARSDLAIHLPQLYYGESELIIAVLSSDYTRSEWCGLEWGATLALLKKRRAEHVMLARFDSVEPPELLGLAGYVDLDGRKPEELAELILQRIAVNDQPGALSAVPVPSPVRVPARPRWLLLVAGLLACGATILALVLTRGATALSNGARPTKSAELVQRETGGAPTTTDARQELEVAVKQCALSTNARGSYRLVATLTGAGLLAGTNIVAVGDTHNGVLGTPVQLCIDRAFRQFVASTPHFGGRVEYTVEIQP